MNLENADDSVTVIITCYNYGKYLPDAVDSVQSQTVKKVQIVVVNDGSDDKHTLDVLAEIEKMPMVRVIHQRNAKTSAARNAGIAQAASRYVCCLDADDCFVPDYLEKCIDQLTLRNLDICGCWQQNFGIDDSVVIPEPFTLEGVLLSNRMIYAAVFKRSLWEQIGGYDETMRDGYEDWEFWIRAAAIGAKATIIPEPLFRYRKHGRSRMNEALEHHEAIIGYIHKKHRNLYRCIKNPASKPPPSSFLNRIWRLLNARLLS